jgi:uncharacterized membrane protein YfcA/uncharacterized membrane protein
MNVHQKEPTMSSQRAAAQPVAADRDALVRQAEVVISGVLRGGVLLSAAVILLGLLLLVSRRTSVTTFPHTLPTVIQSVARGDPLGIIVLGLVLLLLTPVTRVAVSIVAFAREGDRRYVVITSIVLAVLLVSITALGLLLGDHPITATVTTSPAFFFAVFGASIVAGFVGSLVGLGGGVFVVPLMTIFFGIPIEIAVGASIVSVIATSSGAAAAYVRDHLTNLRVGMFLEIATTLGAIAGAFLALVLAPGVLFVVFGLVLIVSAVPLIRKLGEDLPQGVKNDRLADRLALASTYPEPALGGNVAYAVTGVPIGFGLMSIAGLISGLLGIGSGTFKVLAMDTVMKLPMKVSSTTSNFMIGVTAAASAGIYFQRGAIHPLIAAPVALGVLLGALIGAKVLTRLANSTVRKLFVPVLLAIAIEMLVRGFR